MNVASTHSLIPPPEAHRLIPRRPPGFYRILEGPAPLAGCELPRNFHGWNLIYRAGFRKVFCLCSESPHYSPAPLKLAVACELDDLSCIELPRDPGKEAETIDAIAAEIVTSLGNREGCLVHCAAGRGRTGSVIGVVLRMLGFPAELVLEHLNQLHDLRSGAGWPESFWQAELLMRECHQLESIHSDKR